MNAKVIGHIRYSDAYEIRFLLENGDEGSLVFLLDDGDAILLKNKKHVDLFSLDFLEDTLMINNDIQLHGLSQYVLATIKEAKG